MVSSELSICFLFRFNHISIELNNDTIWTHMYLLSIMIYSDSSFLRSPPTPTAVIMEGLTWGTTPSAFLTLNPLSPEMRMVSVRWVTVEAQSATPPPSLFSHLRWIHGCAHPELLLPLEDPRWGLIHFIRHPASLPESSFDLRTIMATLELFTASHLKESTLYVPWWPAVPSLSETLWRDTALTGGRGVQKSLWLTIHGLGDNAKFFVTLVILLCVVFWGGTRHRCFSTLYSRISPSAPMPHTMRHFHWRKNGWTVVCKKAPVPYQWKV